MKKKLHKGIVTIATLTGGLLFFSALNAQTAGPLSGDTAYVIPGNGGNWTNPNNGEKIDGQYTRVVLPANGGSITSQASSNALVIENFGFNITPSTAIITGITVTLSGHDSVVNGDGVTSMVQLVKDGSSVDSILSAGAMQPGTDTTYIAGGHLWGGTWQPSDINNSKFGVSLEVKSKKSVAYVDGFTITVTYEVENGIQMTQSSSGKISMYPNPSAGSVYLNNNGKYELEVFDVCGNLAYKNVLNGPQYINFNTLNNGVYFVRVSSDDNTFTQKLILER